MILSFLVYPIGINFALYRQNGGAFVYISPNVSSANTNLNQAYDMHYGYIESIKGQIANGKFSLNDLNYEDEFPLFDGHMPS